MKREYPTVRPLAFSIAVFATLAFATFAHADNAVPESIRLQQQAEKAYSTQPVVPIDRPNAHHRNLSGEDGIEPSGSDQMPPQDRPDGNERDRR